MVLLINKFAKIVVQALFVLDRTQILKETSITRQHHPLKEIHAQLDSFVMLKMNNRLLMVFNHVPLVKNRLEIINRVCPSNVQMLQLVNLHITVNGIQQLVKH